MLSKSKFGKNVDEDFPLLPIKTKKEKKVIFLPFPCRKIAIMGVSAILKQTKRPHPKIEVDVSTLHGNV